jgi:hypothetical protein
MLTLFLAFLPVTVAVGAATQSRELTFVFGTAWTIATAIVALLTTSTPCPRCSRQFFTGAITSHFWAPRCGHCGQEL